MLTFYPITAQIGVNQLKHTIMKTKLVVYLSLIFVFLASCSKNEVDNPLFENEEEQSKDQEQEQTLVSLDSLKGKWIRIASNNPVNDGMLIEVDGNAGTIVDHRGSDFQNGEVKWKNIEPYDFENFNYEELGSDRNYYSAVIILKQDDTLRIDVGSSGAGNQQKWVREGQYTPKEPEVSEETQVLACDITEATTLVNGPAEIDYMVECVVDITAALTIEPGVVIAFKENAGLGVYDEGTITAVGNDNNPIVLTGSSHIQGWWRGVHIETRSVNNKLEHIKIEDAGSNYVYCCNEVSSIFLKGAKLTLKDLQLSNGGGSGIYINKGTVLDAYSNISIKGHAKYPVKIAPESVGYLDSSGSDYSGNTNDYVFIENGDIKANTTWQKQNVPYLIGDGVLDVTAGLTINAGVEIAFEENSGIGVYDSGWLKIEGLANNRVVMRGKSAVRGFWRGLHLESTNSNNQINYLNLSDAGGNYVYCCNDIASILLKSGNASITNTNISNGKGHGIVANKNFTFDAFHVNQITTHSEAPVKISSHLLNDFDGEKSTYTGNDKDYVLLISDGINEITTVKALDVPYRMGAGKVLDVTEPLNILGGAIFEFESNAGMGVYNNGYLNATGTSENKIIFRGMEDSEGTWRGIHVETNSSNNRLIYAEVSNAGSNYVYCCNAKSSVFLKSGKLRVENSLIEKSGGCGIYVNPVASLTQTNLSFSGNIDGDICD